MSMFKGQGANQALEDGPLLASWLSKPWLSAQSLPTLVRSFEREMLARSLPKVAMSREAAVSLHSAQHCELETCSHFAGADNISGASSEAVLAKLHDAGVTALKYERKESLESIVWEVISELRNQHSFMHS